MYLLDANFFTALPAIILGMICLGVVYFLIFGLISKATGMSIRYRGGITHKGGTVATPDGLDLLGSSIRKTFDKKYKAKKQIQEEFVSELQKAIEPINSQIRSIERNGIYTAKPFRPIYKNKKIDHEPSASMKLISSIMNPSSEILDQFDKQIEELERQKQLIIHELKAKYASKFAELENSFRSKVKNQQTLPGPLKKSTGNSLADELRKLSDLYSQALITKEEFETAKNRLLHP
jgi:hypothetical protein